MKFTIEYVSLLIGFLVVIAGLWGLLTQKNILKIILGFAILNTGIHIVMVSIGYVRNASAPILDDPQLLNNTAQKIVDPVPQALVLTAIVIGLGVTAFMLAYAMKMATTHKSLNINDFKSLKW